MTIDDLKKKRIAILGYGTNNKELVTFLGKQGVPVTIRERRAELQTDLGKTVTWEIMDNILKDLTTFDLVFRSPAIPFLSPALQKAAKLGVEISSQTNLFFDLCPAQIIGITGTKGKGTTATLIYNMLTQSYQEGNVYLAGNIGVDPFQFFEKLTKSDLVILELSSFQLQDLHKSPHIAVVLEVDIDHQDHHKTIQEYRDAKKNILIHQGEDDSAIININNPAMKEYLSLSKGMVYAYERRTPKQQSAWVDTEGDTETVFVQIGSEIHSLDISERKLLGGHNLENILPAVIVASLYAVDPKIMEKEIMSFPGLEHRLHFVGEFQGVSFYDDSIATTASASLAAVKSFGKKRLHLILGGDDKGDDYAPLVAAAIGDCITVSLIPGTATKKISNLIKKYRRQTTSKCQVLEEAREPWIQTILSGIHPHLRKGDVVLLSPAGSSFSHFKNAKERGDLFIKAVKERYNNQES